MATVDPNQQSAAGAQPVAQTAPVAAGGAGVAGGATKQAAATAGVNVPQQKSAQLSAYLNANAPQATALGANVAGQVGNQVSAAQNAILPAVNTYTGQLAVTPTNSTVNQEVATAPASLSAADQQAYQQELAASSQAPNSAATFETTQPYQNLTSQIQNTVEQANLWNAGNNTANLQTALQPYEAPQATTHKTDTRQLRTHFHAADNKRVATRK